MIADTSALIVGKFAALTGLSSAYLTAAVINAEDAGALVIGGAGAVSLVALVLRLVFDGRQQAEHNRQTNEIIKYKDEIIDELRREGKLKDIALNDLRREVDDLRNWTKRS